MKRKIGILASIIIVLTGYFLLNKPFKQTYESHYNEEELGKSVKKQDEPSDFSVENQ
ncbi:hypothetical protein [Peribacillus simplex]|uniref:hypothetical protein n=1 Tax=Peribacillus simplex TaxID=1478 RepID=UPI003D2BDC33